MKSKVEGAGVTTDHITVLGMRDFQPVYAAQLRVCLGNYNTSLYHIYMQAAVTTVSPALKEEAAVFFLAAFTPAWTITWTHWTRRSLTWTHWMQRSSTQSRREFTSSPHLPRDSPRGHEVKGGQA